MVSKTTASAAVVVAVVLCFLYSVTGMELVPTLCVDTCTELLDGDYQSCKGCGEFVVCVGGELYEKECAGGYVWDDSIKRCMENSTTCEETCVQSCKGRINGDYQSCNGCNVYVTCIHGNMYDNRTCPGNLVFNAEIGMCDYTSPTCS